jgi:hypothetical protein
MTQHNWIMNDVWMYVSERMTLMERGLQGGRESSGRLDATAAGTSQVHGEEREHAADQRVGACWHWLHWGTWVVLCCFLVRLWCSYENEWEFSSFSGWLLAVGFVRETFNHESFKIKLHVLIKVCWASLRWHWQPRDSQSVAKAWVASEDGCVDLTHRCLVPTLEFHPGQIHTSALAGAVTTFDRLLLLTVERPEIVLEDRHMVLQLDQQRSWYPHPS